MTQKRYTEIPKRQKCINKEEPYIGGAKDIFDDELGKPQSQVNQEEIANLAAEVERAQQAEGVLDGKVAAEKQRAEGVEGGLNTRLQTVEQLAEISVGGGDIGIGTAADFESDDPEDKAKVPTVAAMLGGANDGVYDISARHSGAKYADLAAALGTNGANVPLGVRRGGMSVKFVQSSDNKYVQYRLMAQNFTTDVTQWQGVDEEPTAGSDNLVKSGGVFNLLATVPFYVKENDIFNPNNGYEGLNMAPSPSFGDNAVVFNVKGNTKYTLSGGEFGFIMEFSQLSITPPTGISTSYFITKLNARQANSITFTTNNETTILAVNNFGDYSKIVLRSGKNVVTFNDFDPVAEEAHSASVAINVCVGGYIENPRNPNPGYEGLVQPQSQDYGLGSISFDVSKFRGKEILVTGNQLGYIMQFGESIDPSHFVDKINADKNKKISLTVNAETTYLTANVFNHDEETIVRGNNSVAYIDDINYLSSLDNSLVCIGDSITQGSGASTYAYNYYWRLRTQLIRDNVVFKSFNFGSGGSTSKSIAAYCGASYLEITENVTIPQSGSVNISLNTNVQDAAGGVTYCNPCYLGGIKGALAYSSGQYSFTREESGDTKFVASGSPLVTMAAKENVNGYILTIFVGTNDNTDTYPDIEQNLIDNIVSISKLSKNNKFIIIQPYVHSTSSTLRANLKKMFGERYIDLYNYMVNMSVYDAIEQGLLPSSSEQSEWNSLLTTDGTHPNDIGHNLIYQQIYSRIKELCY